MRLPKLKVGDPILIEGQDWSYFDGPWAHEDMLMDKYPMDVMLFAGFYIGVKDHVLYWSNVRILWPDDKPEGKHLHRMPLRAITKIKKLR